MCAARGSVSCKHSPGRCASSTGTHVSTRRSTTRTGSEGPPSAGISKGAERPMETTWPEAGGSPVYALTSSTRALPGGTTGTSSGRRSTRVTCSRGASMPSPVIRQRSREAFSKGGTPAHVVVTSWTWGACPSSCSWHAGARASRAQGRA
ncbi:hypothetical protein [Stigmatella aurantiaca]|uniref:hypothetical protein n=1 Tax=Stigmatella aurantiaca TaxID=41 RepID=UPI0015A6C366|nr:hypothetical protein [Stigmatella aurantiaca]